MYTIRNEFHQTEARVRLLTPEALRRAQRQLCGLHDCHCHGTQYVLAPLGVRMSWVEAQAIAWGLTPRPRIGR